MVHNAASTLLIIDDEEDVHYSFQRLFANENLIVHTAGSGEAGLRYLKKHAPDLVVMDIRMGKENGLEILREIRALRPKQLVIMMTAFGTSQTAIEAMKLGAFDYILKPFDIPQLKELIQKALDAAHAMKTMPITPTPLHADDFRTGIVGNSPAMQRVYKLIGQVAPTDATVLITGESGTGKEVLARAIYSNSRRSDKLFMAINCASIPEHLLESELFGHEKGSFTGAVSKRIGRFEQAHGGTLFLDEIGDMPLTLQTKMLRVLQEGEFTRVGSNQSIRTDVRIIAATNKDLASAVAAKNFREDLFYRLNVVHIPVPPLRDRLEDLTCLITYFINKWCSRTGEAPRQISSEALAACQAYSWPGNVRELENCIQRAIVLSKGETILLKDLPPEISRPKSSSHWIPSIPDSISPPSTASSETGHPPQKVSLPPHSDPTSSTPTTSAGPDSLQEAIHLLFQHAKANPQWALLPAVERELIVHALKVTRANQVRAAKLLGITRATLRKRIEKFNIQQEVDIN